MFCVHEDAATRISTPGAYVASTVDNPQELAKPLCEQCVGRHPDFVAHVEAERLHFWMH